MVASRFQRGWGGLAMEGLGHDIEDMLILFPTIQQGRRLVHGFTPAEFGLGYEEKARAKRSVNELKNYAKNYSDENNLEYGGFGGGGKNENTAEYRNIQEALLIGDKDEVVKIKKGLLEGLSSAEKKKTLANLKQSIRGRQPLDAYGVESEKERKRFLRWLKKRAGSAKARELLQVQNRYLRTAKRAGVK